MLLRVSGQSQGTHYDVGAINGLSPESCGIEDAVELVAFAEAAVAGSDNELQQARSALAASIGNDAVVDSAAIVATFSMMVRIADGSGIPLDEVLDAPSARLRGELDLARFSSAANTPGARD